MKILPKGIIEKCTRTVGDKNEIDGIMSPILFLQRIFGYQILDPHWTWKKSLPHQLATGLLITYVIIGTLEIVKNTNDIKLIAEGAYTGIVIICIPTRYYFFLTTRKDFRSLYIQLKTSLFISIKDELKGKIDGLVKKTKIWVFVLLLNMSVMPVMIYILVALWYYVNGERVTMSKTTSILMPMTTPYHEIGIVLHSLFMFEASFIIAMSDIWFLLMMIFFCKSCDNTIKILSVEEYENESRLEYSKRLNKSLRMFYRSHVKEIEFLKTLNASFKWLALMPLISVACCICIILLLMSKGVDLKFVCNLIPTLGELLVYNYFGEQIKNKAQNWKYAVLNFDWTNLQQKDKKNYHIILCYMQKEFGMKTAIGTDLSLVTMSNSLKFSYQAFTVLQTAEI